MIKEKEINDLANNSVKYLETALQQDQKQLAEKIINDIIKYNIPVTVRQTSLFAPRSIFELLIEYARIDLLETIIDSKAYNLEQLKFHFLMSTYISVNLTQPTISQRYIAPFTYLWRKFFADSYHNFYRQSLSNNYSAQNVPKIIHFYLEDPEKLEDYKQRLQAWRKVYPDYVINVWYQNLTPSTELYEWTMKNKIQFLDMSREDWLNKNFSDIFSWQILEKQGGFWLRLDQYPHRMNRLPQTLTYGIQFLIHTDFISCFTVPNHALIKEEIIPALKNNLQQHLNLNLNTVVINTILTNRILVELKKEAFLDNYQPSFSANDYAYSQFFLVDPQFQIANISLPASLREQLIQNLGKIIIPLHDKYEQHPAPDILEQVKTELLYKLELFLSDIHNLEEVDAIANYFNTSALTKKFMHKKTGSAMHYEFDQIFTDKLMQLFDERKQAIHQLQINLTTLVNLSIVNKN